LTKPIGVCVDSRIKDVLLFISTNLDKKITLTKACEHANLSASRFCELYKKETGLCFSKFVIEARTKKASRLLKNKSLSIKQISFECGYRYVSNFNRDFKRIKGKPPSEYRKKRKDFQTSNYIQRMIGYTCRGIGRFAYIIVGFANKK
jgi:AraC-like DNA-binding protein